MSEQEPQEIPANVDPETGEVTEPEPEQDVPFEEPEPTVAEPEPEPEPDKSEATAKQLEAYQALDTKADNYLKACVKIINEAQLPLVKCELDADAYPGLRWAEPQNDEARTMLAVIGAAGGESPLNDDPDANLCTRCNGFGWTKLPSHVPGNTERVCRNCNGAGWLDTNPASGTPVAPAPAATNGEAEPLPGVPETEEWVVQARARGFTIIPPMKIAGAAE